MSVSDCLAHLGSLVECDTQNPPRAIHGDSAIFNYCSEAVGASFDIETWDHGDGHVSWYAVRGKPSVLFNVHLDTVPVGDGWSSNPHHLRVEEGKAYGRGACDIKGAAAALLTLAEQGAGHLALLFTSDEEGAAIDGTAKVVAALQERGERITWCVLGEPTSRERVGDVIKNGRRGSLTGHLKALGQQGHIAYPHRADNPIHRCGPLIDALAHYQWDQGNEFFPSTSFQISNVNGGTGAGNMIPGHVDVQFNFRYSPEVTHSQLQSSVATICERYLSDYRLDWVLFGQPFLTPAGVLVDAVTEAITETVGNSPSLSTDGGTSDGRFIAPTGAQVIELGPVSLSIHKTDEHVRAADLDILSAIYEKILERLLR